MKFTRLSLRRSTAAAVATGAAASALIAAPVAQADMFTYITPAQCRAAHKAIAAGGELPDPSLFRYKDSSSALQGDTLHLYSNNSMDSEVRRAVKAWSDASNGKIKFEFHDKPGPGIVNVVLSENNQGAVAVAGGIKTDQPYIRLRPTLAQSDPDSRLYAIAHEVGHTLGVAHTCAGDLMKAGTTAGALSITPTATDVAAVIQGNDAFK